MVKLNNGQLKVKEKKVKIKRLTSLCKNTLIFKGFKCNNKKEKSLEYAHIVFKNQLNN